MSTQKNTSDSDVVEKKRIDKKTNAEIGQNNILRKNSLRNEIEKDTL